MSTRTPTQSRVLVAGEKTRMLAHIETHFLWWRSAATGRDGAQSGPTKLVRDRTRDYAAHQMSFTHEKDQPRVKGAWQKPCPMANRGSSEAPQVQSGPTESLARDFGVRAGPTKKNARARTPTIPLPSSKVPSGCRRTHATSNTGTASASILCYEDLGQRAPRALEPEVGVTTDSKLF